MSITEAIMQSAVAASIMQKYEINLENLSKETDLNKMIKSITINKEKQLVTTVFSDGDVRISKCSEYDTFDINVGVALCISAHIAGSKSKFRELVAEKLSKKDKKAVNDLVNQ